MIRIPKAQPVYFPGYAPLTPSEPVETDMERLDRLHRSLAYHESKSGRHYGVQAARLRYMVISLSKKIAEGAKNG